MKNVLIVLFFTIGAAGIVFSAGNEPDNRDTGKSSVVESGANEVLLGGIAENTYGYKQVSPDQLKVMLENKDFDLINVHIPYQGEIPKTDANIAFNRVRSIMDLYPEKDAVIVLYCMSGPMSRYAGRELVKAGYTNVVELAGGSNAWKRSGNSLIVK